MRPTELRGARAHNLREVDLCVRPGEVVVITGVSGSGKSSLALDTLYAEGQRRFVESFSPYARQFLERLERPPVTSLDHVPAGVAIDRKAPIKSSRSTVATMADLEPYLCALFAKASVPLCPVHRVEGREVTLASAVERCLDEMAGVRVVVTAPLELGDREAYLAQRDALVVEGHRRLWLRGEVVDIDEVRPSDAVKKKAELVLDRIQVGAAGRKRLEAAFESAFDRLGRVRVHGETTLEFSRGISCPVCARRLEAPRPGFFSYESPLGACENCRGFGRTMGVDLDKVIPDPRVSIREGAIRPWRGKSSSWERSELRRFCRAQGIDDTAPFEKLTREQQRLVIEGDGGDYPGVLGWFEWLETKTYKMHVRVFLSRYRSYDPCPVCHGSRLNEHARSFALMGQNLAEWHELEIREVLALLEDMNESPSLELDPHTKLLHDELSSRLRYLDRVGLGYLTLDRQARTLSGGEAQRVTLTAALGTSLHHALFVLDEPTVGLHAADIAPLTDLIGELAARDNAVLVIEHDPRVIATADRVVELGPASGHEGGTITFDGTVTEARRAGGATARSLAKKRPRAEVLQPPTGQLRVRGVTCHNLKQLDVEIPLGQVVAVSGPSGSGKSSLVVDVVHRAVARHLGDFSVEKPGEHSSLSGAEALTAVELVDQSPLGRTSRGNAATYTKAWDVVRRLFASEPEAEAQGLTASSFSFNVEGGRCEACAGEGHETVEMQFLADVSLVCPVCQGRRFKEQVLAVRHRGRTIADVLDMTVEEALECFADQRGILRALRPLEALGLGYLTLGQPLSTLSGGEAQRLKLARALREVKPGTLFVLDEPSAGLHADEVEHLLEALRILVRAGGSVLLVDHDLDVLSAADHLIELGPGGGAGGGNIVAVGRPSEVAEGQTATGEALRATVVRRSGARPRRRVSQVSALEVHSAREHNLQNVSVEVPHGQLTVVTGPSGSGKSSLSFDVIFAEGQRRFLETLTPYARQFLPTMARPDVDQVFGVPPSIALEQRTARAGARSTVSTVTEVAHFLRLAFAKLGQVHCPDHDEPIDRATPDELYDRLVEGQGRGELWAPVVRARKGTYLDVFTSAERAGVTWAVCDGARVRTSEPPRLARTKEHDIDLVLREGAARDVSRELFDRALSFGQGTVRWAGERGGVREYSLAGACPSCGFSVGELDPRFFSFNTAQGQCPTCEGTGTVVEAPAKARGRRGRKKSVASSESPPSSEAVITRVCPSCDGSRLAPLPRHVRLAGKTYGELTSLSVGAALEWFEDRAPASGRSRRRGSVKARTKRPEALEPAAIAAPIVEEVVRRLRFLVEVGLDYLALDRAASTLSGGEMQRLRLAAQLGAGLTGALYVLDEPTIGLHPRDTGRLLGNLRKLVDTGSTVLVVEHDEDTIRSADHLIDLGPGGGRLGGQVMAEGAPRDVLKVAASPTGRALSAPKQLRNARPLGSDTPHVVLRGARQHNLRGDEVRIPVGHLTVVAGVSGSGKSTLIRGVLLPALRQRLHRVAEEPGTFDELSGIEPIHRAIAVDQSPIGRTPRSVPATFLGIWDEIRRLFAAMPEAQIEGFSAARFSFNTPSGGRCPECQGQGVISHEMSFLPDVVTPCPTCDGLRFDPRTLGIRYLGLSIGEVLQLTAERAVSVFEHHPKIRAPLQTLCDLGAGYITLGQGSHTLSGGEAQRLKLASELTAGARHEPTLYVLDEPTTGLHLADVSKLVHVLDRLVERGDTLVVIEHHPEVIAGADWVIELGPEGGAEGGRVIASAPPGELRRGTTATAQVLREVLSHA